MSTYHGKVFTKSRGLNTTHTFLYRVLRHDEKYTNGLFARYPGANKTVADHTEGGRMFRSQYISTTTSLKSAEQFAVKSRNWPKVVVRINVAQLQTYNVEIIDLTNERVLHKHVSAFRKRAIALARKNKEVLIRNFVPPSCVKFERLLKYPNPNFIYESDKIFLCRSRFGKLYKYSHRLDQNPGSKTEWKRRKYHYNNVRTEDSHRHLRFSRMSVQAEPSDYVMSNVTRHDRISERQTRSTFNEPRLYHHNKTHRQNRCWYSYVH